MKYILYTLVLISMSFTRENPFSKVDVTKSVFQNKNNDLSEIYFNLPDEARSIKEIIVKYKTLDGSRGVKIIDINKRIDWRVPIVVSQKAKAKKREDKKRDYVEFVPFKFIKYRVSDNEVIILTSASNMRHFMLPDPYKLIMDFSYDSYFKTHKENINKSFKTKSIATGSHSGFFRVALELVGKYKYKVTKVRNGYKITFE